MSEQFIDPFERRKSLREGILSSATKQMTSSIMDMILKEAQKRTGIVLPSGAPVRQERRVSEDDMHWQTQDGRKMLASQMETRHLFYSLRLLYNKSVPEEHRVSKMKDGTVMVEGDQREGNLRAIRILCKLLSKRLSDESRDHEFTDEMLIDLAKMQEVIRTIL